MPRTSSTLLHGDCLQHLKGLPDLSVDLTVTSPPYDELRSYNGIGKLWGEHVWKPVIENLYRVTKQGGVVAWIVNDATVRSSETGTSFAQALWAKDCGFSLETMIWEKTGSGAMGSPFYYAQNFEFMFLFVRGRPSRGDLIKDRENKIKSGRVRVNGEIKKDGTSASRTIERKPFGKRTNIWRIDPQKKSGHPAPFPYQLAHDHIVSWSDEGDTVLDPFMGSGTTGIACRDLSRNFIGIELDSDYFKMAESRMSAPPTLFQ